MMTNRPKNRPPEQTLIVPRQLAERLGVNVSKVLGWIRSGELRAINTSDSPRRPRWRITPEAIEALELARSNQPAERAQRARKKKLTQAREYV